MIKNTTPLSMPEALEYVKNPEVKSFIKKFTNLNEKKAKELREKLVGLELIKLNDIHISKIIEILPDEKEELSKILPASNLDENETNTILSTIKEFK
ncbi:hypothetical protein GW931_03800 [archaeon]|nr:hypothetical protein [archaeon]PJC45722.1 MAG: hypothetical protein CO037_00040 [Candidatus Pacearchaeota archaeon CG_4_9_14_0_2_um_filter_30_8]